LITGRHLACANTTLRNCDGLSKETIEYLVWVILKTVQNCQKTVRMPSRAVRMLSGAFRVPSRSAREVKESKLNIKKLGDEGWGVGTGCQDDN